MAPSQNPLKGKIEVIGETLFSIVYSRVDEPNIVLKAHEVWVDGESHGSRDFVSENEIFKDLLEREAAVYQRLGDHPRITKCFGLKEVAPGFLALHLERSPSVCPRVYIMEQPKPDMRVRFRMALQFAEGVDYLHQKGVTWCDLSTRNALFFDNLEVKLCDFGGALIEGSEYKEIQSYETRYHTPKRGRECDEIPWLVQELFALGSAIYEFTEWRVPYGDVSEDEADIMVSDDVLPGLTDGNPAASIIAKCWSEGYSSASEVVQDLRSCMVEWGLLES